MRDDTCAEGSIYPLEVEYTKKSSAVAEMGDRARAKWAEKWEGGFCVPFRGGAGSPSNTMWPGPRPTSVPNGILIHSTVFDHNTPTVQTDRTDSGLIG